MKYQKDKKNPDLSLPPEVWENFKLKKPSRMREDMNYNPFQAYSIYMALNNSNFVIGLPAGTGKTLVAYSVIEHFMDHNPDTKFLFVTNNSAILQVTREWNKFFEGDDRTILPVYSGYDKKNYKKSRHDSYKRLMCSANYEPVDGLVLNWRIFALDHKEIIYAIDSLKSKGYKIVLVLDEATNYKNTGIKTFKVVQNVSKRVDKSIALTATLLKGELEDSYGIFAGLNIFLTDTKEEFHRRYCFIWNHPDPKKWFIKVVIGYKNVQEFIDKIREYSVVIKKSDVDKYFPGFVPDVCCVEVTDEQMSVIRDLELGILKVSQDGEDFECGIQEIETVSVQGHIKRTLLDPRLVTGSVSLTNYSVMSPKTEEIIRILSDELVDEKTIIYSSSRRYIELLGGTIKNSKKVPEFYKKIGYIHGTVSIDDREITKQKFQETDEINLILMTNAGSESINLQSGKVLILMDIPKTAGDLVQLAGRISRIGSKHDNLYIKYIIASESQDWDEYIICQQQLALMATVLGESEKGLVDWNLLENVMNNNTNQLQDKSISSIIFNKRKKRKSTYTKKLRDKKYNKDA